MTKIGKNAINTLHEPSIGPCFGINADAVMIVAVAGSIIRMPGITKESADVAYKAYQW